MRLKDKDSRMQGQIIKALAGFYYVESDGQVYQTRARGNFRKKGHTPYVGDWVDFSAEENSEGYILKVDLAQHIQNFKNPDLPIKVVANLPYYITTPILMHLIESGIPFSEFVVMMQKEVADRISAQPNTKAYGSLSIAVQYYMTAKVAFIVPRTVFVPAPNVDSAILKMVRRPEPAVAVEDENFFFKVSKASFTHRRKTLWNNLTGYFGKTDDVKDKLTKALDQAGLAPSVRGEALGLEEFASLADALKGQGL